MTTWDREAVLAASGEWSWVPEGTPHVWTSGHPLVRLDLPAPGGTP